MLIIKPKTQQENEAIEKLIKEKIDIKNMEITKLRKGSKRTDHILGCETEKEIKSCKKYKDQVG